MRGKGGGVLALAAWVVLAAAPAGAEQAPPAAPDPAAQGTLSASAVPNAGVPAPPKPKARKFIPLARGGGTARLSDGAEHMANGPAASATTRAPRYDKTGSDVSAIPPSNIRLNPGASFSIFEGKGPHAGPADELPPPNKTGGGGGQGTKFFGK